MVVLCSILCCWKKFYFPKTRILLIIDNRRIRIGRMATTLESPLPHGHQRLYGIAAQVSLGLDDSSDGNGDGHSQYSSTNFARS